MSKLFMSKATGDKVFDAIVSNGIKLARDYMSANGKPDAEYKDNNDKFTASFMEFCAKKTAFGWNGMESLKNPMVTKDNSFRSAFNAVIAQIITPIAPEVVSAKYMELAEVHQIGWGDTGRFIVKPNELFQVTDVAEGVLRGGLQRLYNDEMVVNPIPKQVAYDMPWYQVAAGLFDFGEWSYKIGVSFAGYINALVIQAYTKVITDAQAASSPYVASGFSDANFINVAQKVQVANGNNPVYGMGSLTVLGKILPTTVGLQYGLGEEIAKKGFLDMYKGVRMMEIGQNMVPGTVNTTATLMVPNDTLYFISMGAYKPIKIVFEGENVSVDTVPTETPDKTGGLSVTMRLGVSAVVGSKFGAITGIS